MRERGREGGRESMCVCACLLDTRSFVQGAKELGRIELVVGDRTYNLMAPGRTCLAECVCVN